MDGAILPIAVGVNPTLTISCLAERCMRLLADREGWHIDYDTFQPLGRLTLYTMVLKFLWNVFLVVLCLMYVTLKSIRSKSGSKKRLPRTSTRQLHKIELSEFTVSTVERLCYRATHPRATAFR